MNLKFFMSLPLAACALTMLLTARLLCSQLPPSQKLSAEENRAFNQELDRLRSLLATANDQGTIRLQIAKTYAAGGQYAEAIQCLREVVDADLGFDPSRDPDFASIRSTIEFQRIMEEVRHQTPPVSNSRHIRTIYERDLSPENLAFDPTRKTFFLGNTARHEIVRCLDSGACVPLVPAHRGEPGYVLGLKIDERSRTLWATSNTEKGASLRQYDIESGKLIRTASVEGKHVFNDVALSSAGIVYVSDTRAGSVYQLDTQTGALREIAPEHTFTAANGIAISPGEETLYVSTWGDGIDVVDLRIGSVKPIPHPASVCLAFIDGLYATRNSLIAIQNGPMSPRIVQFRLNNNGREITGMTTLERRNPLFEGITTGVLTGNQFYYVANPQIEKTNATRNPLQILALRVPFD
jgi:hypothetical protein